MLYSPAEFVDFVSHQRVGVVFLAIAFGVEFDATFDGANRAEIFVEFLPVGFAHLGLEASRIVQHEVHDALVAASRTPGRVGGTEQAVEGELGIDFLRERGGGGAPGYMRAIKARIAD